MKIKYLFKLELVFPRYSTSVVKAFNAKNSRKAHELAEKWMNNCLAICGKDEDGNKYLSAKLNLVH